MDGSGSRHGSTSDPFIEEKSGMFTLKRNKEKNSSKQQSGTHPLVSGTHPLVSGTHPLVSGTRIASSGTDVMCVDSSGSDSPLSKRHNSFNRTSSVSSQCRPSRQSSSSNNSGSPPSSRQGIQNGSPECPMDVSQKRLSIASTHTPV